MTINPKHIKPGMMIKVHSLQNTELHVGVVKQMPNMVGKTFKVKSVFDKNIELWEDDQHTDYWTFHVDDIIIPDVNIKKDKKIKSEEFSPTDKFKGEIRAYVLRNGLEKTKLAFGLNNDMIEMQGGHFKIYKPLTTNKLGLMIFDNNKNPWSFHLDDLGKIEIVPPLPLEIFDIKQLDLS